MKIINRKCLVCGKEIKVSLNKDGTYSNGNYFGKINGKEYWECNNCYNQD